MMLLTKLPNGILIQRDDAEILIDDAAMPTALPIVIRELVDSGRALGLAKLKGYEEGLVVGIERGRIEEQARQRREEQRLLEADELLALALARTHLAA